MCRNKLARWKLGKIFLELIYQKGVDFNTRLIFAFTADVY
jgi:hypothetical protein